MKIKLPVLWVKRASLIVLVMMAAAIIAIAWANIIASWSARGRTFDTIANTPSSEDALIRGRTRFWNQ
ncbi:MAG: hypothetical protein RLY69_328 [Verrucomicrobiota bacterium]